MITAKFMNVNKWKYINYLANIWFGLTGAVIVILLFVGIAMDKGTEFCIKIGAVGIIQLMALEIFDFIMSHMNIYVPKNKNGGGNEQ